MTKINRVYLSKTEQETFSKKYKGHNGDDEYISVDAIREKYKLCKNTLTSDFILPAEINKAVLNCLMIESFCKLMNIDLNEEE